MTSTEVRSRPGGRGDGELRPVELGLGPMKFADGSASIHVGDTQVLIGATVESRVPPFLFDSGQGWATAEYAMLPRATPTRSTREVKRGRPSGRSSEIQRLIGRSLRAALDLTALGERTLILDCDVLQADGGTRTASVTGAYVAAVHALSQLYLAGDLDRWPFVRQVAAVSVGIVDGRPRLDLEASEDQRAEVDLNVIATAAGEFIEVQGTGEKRSFARRELDDLLDLAFAGIETLVAAQNRVLEPILAEVEALESRGERREVPPKDERNLWGRP